jgi:hypothetical protein
MHVVGGWPLTSVQTAEDSSRRFKWTAPKTLPLPLGDEYQMAVQQIDDIASLADFHGLDQFSKHDINAWYIARAVTYNLGLERRCEFGRGRRINCISQARESPKWIGSRLRWSMHSKTHCQPLNTPFSVSLPGLAVTPAARKVQGRLLHGAGARRRLQMSQQETTALSDFPKSAGYGFEDIDAWR